MKSNVKRANFAAKYGFVDNVGYSSVLNLEAWYAIFAGDFELARTESQRAIDLVETQEEKFAPMTNRAHALMMLNRITEARDAYMAGRGLAGAGKETWEHTILRDFIEFRAAGLMHPLMAEIEAAFKKGNDSFDFSLLGTGSTTTAPASTAAAPSPDEFFWLAVRDSSVPALFDEFLKKFPASSHAADARKRLDEIKAQVALAAPPEMKLQRIVGRWILRREGQPGSQPVASFIVEADGEGIIVRGDSWRGSGSFDGESGSYRWAFADGKSGLTTFSIDRNEMMRGQVRGSGIDWDYLATRH